MSSRIKVLATELANQIAAGEVIERPASVIKELVENSLDAHAKKISIHVSEEVTDLLQVIDEGDGVHPDDLLLTIKPHATSKITSFQDLEAIGSFGFRGEALASISSVSKFILKSNEKQLIATPGEEVKILPNGKIKGTYIQVESLFYNTPVRRRFLRSNKMEFSAIEKIVKAMALAHFDIEFHLTWGEKKIIQVKAATNQIEKEKRVVKLLGNNFLQHAIFIDVTAQNYRLYGWIALVEYSRSTHDQQYCFVNHRYVRDSLMVHAIRQAYLDRLPIGRQPAYVIYLDAPNDEVDVNVHPTKHELRFHQSRWVHDFIVQQLSKVLSTKSYEIKKTKQKSESLKCAESLFSQASQTQLIACLKNFAIVSHQDKWQIFHYVKAKQLLAFEEMMQQKPIKTQQLLLPIQKKIVAQELCLLHEFGVIIDALSEDVLVLRAIPLALNWMDESLFFERLITAYQQKKLFSLMENKENFLTFLSHCSMRESWFNYDEAQIQNLLKYDMIAQKCLKELNLELLWQS